MSGLEPISSERFKKAAPKIPWIVEGLVAQGALTVLAGVGGLGKSLLALALATASAKGQTTCAGFNIEKHVRMMYVDAENGIHEMHRRAHAFQTYDGFYGFSGNLEDHEPSLAHYANQEPSFLVLDSCRALFPAMEEDNSKSVLPVLSRMQTLARATNCGVLLLHHTTKGGSTFRGSGEFQNRPEITVTMKRDSHGHRHLDWEKCRLGVEPERHYLQIENVGERIVWHSDPPTPARSYVEPDSIFRVVA